MNSQETFAQQYLSEAAEVLARLDIPSIEKAALLLAEVRRQNGRLFILGVGGGAANASHAVNDFRKIAAIEAYAPTDNVSELTARVNDEGWETVFDRWLRTSHLRASDLVMVFSVGGGHVEANVSPNLVAALRYAQEAGAGIIGIVGRDGGYTAKVADACIIIPTVNREHVTPHTEAFQAIVWHLLVSHPAVKMEQTKWESQPLERAVFLDRDGVLNRAVIRDGKPYAPANVAEIEIPTDVPAALQQLKQRGYKLLVVSNQPDVKRGTLSRDAVEAINQALAAALPLDDVLVCYHTDEDGCDCRKPEPGMLLQAARKYNLDLGRSIMVGDRWRDVEAGHNAGCKTVLLDLGYHEQAPAWPPDARVASLQDAVNWIVQRDQLSIIDGR